MGVNLERRLQRIKENLSKKALDISDMTDDELAQIVTGNPISKASDLTQEQLEAVIREAKQ